MRAYPLLALALVLASCEAGQVIRSGEDRGPDTGTLDVVFPDALDPGAADGAGGDTVGPDVADDPAQDVVGVHEEITADTLGDAVENGQDTNGDVTTGDAWPADLPVPVSEKPSAAWARLEHFHVDNDGLTTDKFLEKIQTKDPEIFAAFGSVTPGPGEFLLHSAAGWDQAGRPVVVLVHGAGTDANQSFVSPDSGSDRSLVKALSKDFRVFAITFPHPFGDTLNQAIELAGALSVVRHRTGADRVSIVAHSKGGISALAYLCGLGTKWGVPYAGDVDRIVMLGVPLGGMDFSFRHPSLNYSADLLNLMMPSSWDKEYVNFQWKDTLDISIYGGAFQGLLQVLAPWVDTYALNPMEQDWYTTYYGGDGFVSHSKGIFAAIELGGSFLDKLKAAEFPKDVEVAIGAGGSNLIEGVPWEATGPSDGMIFVKSATDEALFDGAKILANETFGSANHWDLLFEDEVTAFVAKQL
jgi:pimeloyl-ACP methyl ester carboxylesterase